MLELTDGVVGMAGQWIAAVLETAGLFGQAEILARFSVKINEIGALVYAWCLAGALASVALFGNYRRGAWFLIGPALFFFMLGTTLTVNATAQRFGDRSDTTIEEQMKTLRTSGDPKRYENPAKVAWFFVHYDNLVSYIIQKTVTLLVDTRNNEDLVAAARDRVMAHITHARAEEADFIKLLSKSLLGTCARYTMLSRQVGQDRLTNPVSESPEERELQAKLREIEKLKTTPVPLEEKLLHYVNTNYIEDGEEQAASPSTCDSIFEYTRRASFAAARKILDPVEGPFADEFKENPEVLSTAYEHVHCKLQRGEIEEGGICRIDGEFSPEDMEEAANVLAAFYLRNSITHTAHSGLVTQMEGREGWHKEMYQRLFGNIAAHEASTWRKLLTYFAGSIPYIQGVIIYLLTIAFPFFAIFLIMPSRFEAFIVWMTLWLWVKSWDVGFAFVVFLKEVFWQMMPNAGMQRTNGNFTELDWADPAAFFNVLYLNDPVSSLNTYFTIIGVVTLSVPLFTAHLCLGATNLYNSLKMSINQNVERLRNDVRKSERTPDHARINALIQSKRAETMANAANNAGANLGNLRDGTPIAAVGGNAISREMKSEAAIAGFNYAWSEEQRDLLNYRASLHRLMTYQGGIFGYSDGVLDALASFDNEVFLGPPAGKFNSQKLVGDKDIGRPSDYAGDAGTASGDGDG